MVISVTGQPLVTGDRVLYLCQCGRASCGFGERATIISREEVVAHFDDVPDDPDVAFAKFDGDDLPAAAKGEKFIHLSSLGVEPARQGADWKAPLVLRALLVDEVTRDSVPGVVDAAHLVIDITKGEAIKVPTPFDAVEVVGVQQSVDLQKQGEAYVRTMEEGMLAIGIALDNPNVGGQG